MKKHACIYILISILPIIISIISFLIVNLILTSEHEPFIIAGLGGTVALSTYFLKRWHDIQVVKNAFIADLECFSTALRKLLDTLPTGDERNDCIGIVNITTFSRMDIYNKFIDKIGLLPLNHIKKLITIYAQLHIFVPATTLIPGVTKIDQDQLKVSQEGFAMLRRSTTPIKNDVDAFLTVLKE